jgi:hypothetical protein
MRVEKKRPYVPFARLWLDEAHLILEKETCLLRKVRRVASPLIYAFKIVDEIRVQSL